MSLFREDARKRSTALKGTSLEVELNTDRQHLILSAIAIAIVVILVASLFVWEHKRRIRVVGRVTSAEAAVRVVAQTAGQILGGMLVEGKVVRRGDVLLTLNSERTASGVSVDRAELKMLQQQIDLAERQLQSSEAIFEAQRKQHENTLASTKAMLLGIDVQMALEISREKIGDNNLANSQRLATAGFISEMQVSQRYEETLAQRARSAQLHREKASIELNLANALGELHLISKRSDVERGRLMSNIVAFQRQLGEIQLKVDSKILSPVDGIVTAVKVSRGQAVAAGETMLTVLPMSSPLQGRALVPSAAMGFLRSGQQVFLHYLAFPYQKFGHQRGTVASYSVATVSTESGPREDNKNKDSYYEVVINLESQSLPGFGTRVSILPDMQFEADIVTESRTIFEWIFEPLFAIARR